MLRVCPADNKQKIGHILQTIKTITQGFRQKLPEAFKPSYKALIDNLIPILNDNLGQEELTSQILVFIHSNVVVLGVEMMQTVCQVVSTCST